MSAYGFCERDVNKKCKTNADICRPCRGSGFFSLKIGYFCHYFAGEDAFEAIYMFGKSLFMCQQMVMLVRQLKKTSESLVRLRCLQVLRFDNFQKYSCSLTFVKPEDTPDLV